MDLGNHLRVSSFFGGEFSLLVLCECTVEFQVWERTDKTDNTDIDIETMIARAYQ